MDAAVEKGDSDMLKKKLRILIAEDNDINSRLADRMLCRLGYQARIVVNGREAIDTLQSEAYDLVLMDLQMPVMDGFEATRWIYDHPEMLQQVPAVVAMTANTRLEDRQKAAEVGMVDFIAKPISLDRLRSVLQQWD